MNKVIAALYVFAISSVVLPVQAFSGTSPGASNGNKDKGGFLADTFRSIFSKTPSFSSSPSSTADDEKRNALKIQLLEACRSSSGDDREHIETIMNQLAELRPIQETATDPALQKLWKLEWTTEKEINFFVDVGICTGDITQRIDGSLLQNNIPWKNGGLGVSGDLTTKPNDNVLRTEFEFKVATLDFGGWGKYNLPPVGKGWFDTIYLDDELRVDTNSRNDILICTPL